MPKLDKAFILSAEIQSAQRQGQPIVALESTVITHGLPKVENLALAKRLEEIVREGGAVPATIGLLDGKIRVGMAEGELTQLAEANDALKISSRDIAYAVSAGKSGGTTVAATAQIAAICGIRVFATGGIGGVHRGSHWDVSADLGELARQRILLVCAGAKSILDLPATLEKFETLSVPLLGLQSDEFPAFYSRHSGLKVSARMESLEDAVRFADAHWRLGGNGIVLAVPPPEEEALPFEEVEAWIATALSEAEAQGIHGPASTPFLLKRLGELSGGRTLQSNLALLENNARVAAELAKQMPAKLAAGQS